MAAELLFRRDLGKKAYRLKCRFFIEANPKPGWLEKAKYAAAEWFVEDMAKEGFEYLDKHGFRMRGPFPAVYPVTLPNHPPVLRARDVLAMARAGVQVPQPSEDSLGVRTMPLLVESEKWAYELAAVFIHKTILMESPEPYEAQEMLKE